MGVVSHKAEVEQYCRDVMTGKLVTGRLVRLAVMRYLDDKKNAGSRGYYFSEAAANDVLNFYPMCCHTQGSRWSNQPIQLEPWQKFIIWNLFGWRCEDDDTRRFRKAFIEVARKNGKTTMVAPLAIYMMLCDFMPGVEGPSESGAQGYCAATKEDQAKLLFKEVVRMLRSSPELREMVKIGQIGITQRVVKFEATGGSEFTALGSDSDSQDGFNIHLAIRDELHAWRERHRGLAEKLDSADGSRDQPLVVTITTAGDELSTLWSEDHDRAEAAVSAVLTGDHHSDEVFSFIAAIDVQEFPCFECLGSDCPHCHGTGTVPKDDPFEDAACVAKANPNSGVSKSVKTLSLKLEEARNFPHKRNEFLRYQCNVRVAAIEKAVLPEVWAACAGDLSDWQQASRIHGGFDLGRSNDMAAAGLVARFDEADDDGKAFLRFEVRGRAWTCQDRPETVRTNQIERWIEAGILGESDGDQVRFGDVEDWIASESSIVGARTWAFDPNFALRSAQRLQEEFGLTIFKFTQSAYHYNEAVRTFLKALTAKHIVNGKEVRGLTHDGDPVLAWMVNNLVIRRDQKDHWMPDKGSSPQKIDLAVALLMALSECIFSDGNATPSGKFYETNPLEFA